MSNIQYRKILALGAISLNAQSTVTSATLMMEAPPCYNVKAANPKPKHPKLKQLRKLK